MTTAWRSYVIASSLSCTLTMVVERSDSAPRQHERPCTPQTRVITNTDDVNDIVVDARNNDKKKKKKKHQARIIIPGGPHRNLRKAYYDQDDAWWFGSFFVRTKVRRHWSPCGH